MKGLDIARAYWTECGRPMLERDFPHLMPHIAAAFTGSGSERYGFDDDVSRDHDFEPGFLLLLPGEDVVSRRDAFLAERAYAKLPSSFMGLTRQPLSPVGGSRNGVMRLSEHWTAAVGTPDGRLSVGAWLHLPDYALAEAVNGEVFYDGAGELTKTRAYLCAMPSDILRKRLAGNLLLMAQAGQYNYLRCLHHGEPEAAQLACVEFVQAAMKVTFLLHGRYMPYYKWSFRALRTLPGGEAAAHELSGLLSGDNTDARTAAHKAEAVERISTAVISRLREKHLSDAAGDDLEPHAYAVNGGIADAEIRNLHILDAV